MYRYGSDSDENYYTSRQLSDNVRSSGWQSPIPRFEEANSSLPSSSVTRLVVDSPFGTKKCDYTIDRSQPGRLIVTARRRPTFGSDYLSLNNKNNNTAIQTFTIPFDADVNHLQSRVEQYTNRLIIEIPRTRSGIVDMRNTYVRSPFRRDDRIAGMKDGNQSRKFEYQVDCHGYKADDLDVFIEGRDVIVRGRKQRSTASDPHYQQQQSKEFSRQVSLPNTVDLSRVVTFFDNGQLKIEAPYKRSVYYDEGEIISPIGGNHRRHYRRRERVNRQQQQQQIPSTVIQRARSADALNYPLTRSIREWDDGDNNEDHFYRRAVKYKHYNTEQKQQQPSIYRSYYEPSNNGVITRTTTYRTYPSDHQMYSKY